MSAAYRGLVVPLSLKADMARKGILPNQLAPYDDPEHGWTDPKNDPDVKAALWSLVGVLWAAPVAPPQGDPGRFLPMTDERRGAVVHRRRKAPNKLEVPDA